jgi:preprotein translocase subunit SecD
VEILEQRTVGPSLGHDSIQKGIISIIVGGIAVLIFIVFYYRVGGMIANFALFFNLLLILAALAALQATLTLPGIAGIVLTIGMAVDANVLIFERIREELHLGKSFRAALDGGYSKAFLTILDANLTTLIAALVLMQFGTGPIRGFAVTLSIGIAVSMFTAILVTRMIFDFILRNRKVTKVSI